MRKLICSSLLLSLFTVSAVSAKAPAKKAQKEIDYLFVQMAPTATLQQSEKGTYKLRLTDASPYVKYFTNRPARITGMMPIKKFLVEWKHHFNQVTPNAGIYGIQGRHEPVSIMVELTQPVYDAKNHTITYTAHPLNHEKALPQKMQLRDVAVFIDDFCASCSGGGF